MWHGVNNFNSTETPTSNSKFKSECFTSGKFRIVSINVGLHPVLTVDALKLVSRKMRGSESRVGSEFFS